MTQNLKYKISEPGFLKVMRALFDKDAITVEELVQVGYNLGVARSIMALPEILDAMLALPDSVLDSIEDDAVSQLLALLVEKKFAEAMTKDFPLISLLGEDVQAQWKLLLDQVG